MQTYLQRGLRMAMHSAAGALTPMTGKITALKTFANCHFLDFVAHEESSALIGEKSIIIGESLSAAMGRERAAKVAGQLRPGQLFNANVRIDEEEMICDMIEITREAPQPWLLKKQAQVAADPHEEYMAMDLPSENVILVDCEERLGIMLQHFTAFAKCAAEDARPFGTHAIGLDCEWPPSPRRRRDDCQPVSLLQMAVEEKVYVIDLQYFLSGDAFLPEEQVLLNDSLALLLSSNSIVKAGFAPAEDIRSLRRSYGHIIPCFWACSSFVDVSKAACHSSALLSTPRHERSSLSKLSRALLGRAVDKTQQCSSWGDRPLTPEQLEYAALDARLHLLIFQSLQISCPSDLFPGKFAVDFYGTPQPLRQQSKTLNGRSKVMKGAGGLPQQAKKVSLHDLNVDCSNLVFGKPLESESKKGVIDACVPNLHLDVFFDQHSPVLEFRNAIVFLVNVPPLPGEDEDAPLTLGREVTWCCAGISSESLVNIVSELNLLPQLSELERTQRSEERRKLFLFCRRPRKAFSYYGEVSLADRGEIDFPHDGRIKRAKGALRLRLSLNGVTSPNFKF